MAQYAHLAKLHPGWLAAISSAVRPRAKVDDIANYRIQVSAAIRSANNKIKMPDLNNVITTNLKINQNGHSLPCRIYIPKIKPELGEKPGHKFPLLYWSFSGGFCTGTLDDADVMLRRISITKRITCASVAYRLAPENPFPAAVIDVYAGLKWTLANANSIAVDINKSVLVGGASAGGNLSAVIINKSLTDDEIRGKITGQLLIMPILLAPSACPDNWKSELLSWEKNKYSMLLSKKDIDSYLRYYLGGTRENAFNPDVSPLLTPSFQNLPPTYIQIAGCDPLRDEGFLYERLLREAGVKTKTDIYPGLPHIFHFFAPNFIMSKKQDADFSSAIEWLLKMKRPKRTEF